MTSKIVCVLSSDPKLSVFEVDIDLNTSVSSLKKAIHAQMKRHLEEGVEALDLTLIRIGRADVGGLTKKELQQSKEPFSLMAYGEDPEDGDDNVSAFQSALGFCLVIDGLFFKVRLLFFKSNRPTAVAD
ncbi:hypothetical protein HK100_010356, partial [Physocladia obscura]